MSREIDERVVQMKFESGQFEKNIQTSIHSLEELKKGMDFQNAAKGFEKIDNASKSINVDPITRSIQQLNSHFNLLGITALNVMNRISNAAIDTGEKMLKSLTIDQITPGWAKYADKTTAVQTIMAATANEFSDTAKQMAVVNEQLDKLNWFTDETSYNFVDMVSNISKFTSNNISLEKSVTAMQGIANWAAKSGANANEASRAMYNLSQALASGAVTKIDWKSIENANMSTTEFKKTAAETAVQLGLLKKVGDDTFQTLNGKVGNTVQLFGDLMQTKWFTSDVLIETLKKYGGAVDLLQNATEKYGTTASHMIKDVQKYTTALNDARAEASKMEKNEADTLAYVNQQTSGIIESLAEKWDTTFEDAKETLAQFDDEMIQFSLDAFKYGQEAKTFAEAIGSVTDAVSTKWMKTFELLFGNYQEAKEFWTNIANTLYDIFAASGDARNELLEDWRLQGGQKYFTDAIYAGLAAILSILSPIKAAWNSVFGSVSAEQLVALTKKLRDFLLKLTASEETMQKIARVFRGLFSVLDLIRTVIGELAGGLLQGFRRIMAELGIDVGEFAASAGDVVYYLTQWIKQTGVVRKGINLLVDAIIVGIRSLKSFLVQLSNWGPAQKAVSKFKDVAIIAFKGLGSAVYVLIDVFYWLFQQLQNFHLPTSFSDIAQFFSDFAKKVGESFQKVGIASETLGDGFGVLGTIVKNTVTAIVGVFAIGSQGIVASLDMINRYMSSVDWSGVLLAAFGISTIALMWKFATALNTLAGSIKNVTNVGAKAGGALDAIKTYFNTLTKNVQTNNILKTAIAITSLAIACGLLARMDWAGVLSGGAAILMISGAVIILTNAFDKWSTKHGSINGKGMVAMTQFVLSLAASMVAITYALNAVRIDDDLGKRLAVLGGALIALSAATAIFSRVAKPIKVGAGTLLGIVVSILLMVRALKSIKFEDAPAILAVLPVASALMLVMALLTKLMVTTKKTVVSSGNLVSSAKSGSGILSIIGLVAGLHLMISAIKTIAKMQPDVAAKGIILLTPVIILLKTLLKHVGLASKEAKSAGKMVMYIAVAVNLLYFAIKNLAKLNMQEIVQGGAIVTALMGLSMLLVNFSGKAGKYAAKAGLMIMEIAGALAIIQLVIKTLGRIDLATAIKGTASVSIILLAIGQMLKGMDKQLTINADGLKALTKITIIIGMISALVLALTWIDPLGALGVTTGLALFFVSFKGVIETLKFADDIKMDGITKIMVFAGVVGGLIGLLGAFTDWKGALAIAGGMSLVLVSLGAMMKIANKTSGGLTKAKLAPMAAMILELGVIVGALALLSNQIKKSGGMDYGVFWSLTGALTAIMAAFGLMTKIMGSMKGKPTKENILPILSIIGALTLVVGALALMSHGLNVNWKEMLAITTSLSEIMVALGLMSRLISGVKAPEDTAGIQRLTIVIGAISGIMAVIAGIASAYGADLSQMLTMATSMSLLLVAIGASIRIMNGKTFKMDLKMVATLGALVAGLGGILAIFSTWPMDPNNLLPLALGMVPLLAGVATSAVILSHFRSGGMSGALQGIVVVLAIIAGMALILTALGGLDALFGGGFSWVLEKGIPVLTAIGEGIGGFIGGIVGGVAGGVSHGFTVAAKNISDGMNNLQPFFDGLKKMPPDVLELCARMVGTIGLIGNASFKVSLMMLGTVAESMESNGENLDSIFAAFGRALKAFSDEVQGIDIEAVSTGVDASIKLAILETALPKKGGLLQTILGEDDLESFAGRLESLGSALVTFSEYGALIDSNGLAVAVKASGELQAIEGKLPAKDGALQDFLGQDGFDKFGERLATYGEALVSFSDSVSGKNGGNGLDLTALEDASVATERLVNIENTMDSHGGLLSSIFFGDNDFGKFGTHLAQYGKALQMFSDSIHDKVNLGDVGKAVRATEQLSDIEGKLNVHGGWNAFWNGDNTFKQFGTNLKSFGSSLQSFGVSAEGTKWSSIETAVQFIEDMTKIEKLEAAAETTLTTAKTLMTKLLEVIKGQEVEIRDEARNMANWLAEGFASGVQEYQNIALSAAAVLATNIVAVMNAKFKIASPSVVMKEMGHWVVKGLGEGISKDMSAEEAAEQKAQDIISAFQSGLNKMTNKLDVSNLEYELWTRTEGKNATDAQKQAKKLDLEVEKLKEKAKEVSMLRTAMNAVLETAGKDSDAYVTAYKNYLQAQNDMYDQQAVVDELQATNVKADNRSRAEQVKQFIQVQKDNAEMFEAMGKSEEELRIFAATVVGEDFLRQMRINDVLLEQKDKFDELGYSMEQRTAEAEKILGYDVPKQTKSGLYNTTEIIAQAMEETSYTLENAVAKSVSKSVGSGVSAGVSSGLDDLGGDLQQTITKAMENIEIPDIDFEASGWGKLEDMLDIFNDPSSITSKISSFFGEDNGVLGAIKTNTQPITDAVKSWGSDLASSIFGDDQVAVWKDGAKKWLGSSGVAGGMADEEALKSISDGGENLTQTAIDGMKAGNNDDGVSATTRTYDEGEHLTNEYAAGISNEDALDSVSKSSEQVADVASTEVSESVPLYRPFGQEVSKGFALGMLDYEDNVVSAAKKVAEAANTAFHETLKVESPSKVTRGIGRFVSEGLAIGMDERKNMVINSAEDVANGTISALDYTKGVINDLLQSDDNFAPTITPVLDLDTLTKEAKSIPSLLDRNTNLNLGAVARRANLIQTDFEQIGQNGSPGTSQTNYNFTQNNYSPKALNRVEIYRQTQNQFAQLKGATKSR